MYEPAERLARRVGSGSAAKRPTPSIYPCSVVTADTVFDGDLQRVNPLFRMAADRARDAAWEDDAA